MSDNFGGDGAGVAMKTGTLEEVGTLKAAAPLHVLIVENLPNDVALMLLELRKAGLYLDHTLGRNKEQFRHALQQDQFDAILCDYRLPGWTGLEALQVLRETVGDILLSFGHRDTRRRSRC